MDGYNNQGWPHDNFSNGAFQNFYDELQQHATPQQPSLQYHQPYPNHTYRQQPQQQPLQQPQQQPLQQPVQRIQQQPQQQIQLQHQQQYGQQRFAPRVEVAITSRPQEYQGHQQPQSQPMYQYNQQYVPQQLQYQQIYQYPPQLDGTANGIPSTPIAPPPTQTPLQPVQNGVSKHTPSSASTKPAIQQLPETPKVDYAQILLVLAEEYMDAADKAKEDSEMKFKLISFALGCTESVLKNYQLPPLREAQVSLTYCRWLYEKTENHDEAEKALTKAIELCERNKYLDLKYALLLLSVRFLYQTKPKAALKALAGYIEEMEAYRHIAWLYVFYYEAAVLSLSQPTLDRHHAIGQLEKLEELATRHHDKAVVAFAAIMSALVHLQTSQVEAVSSAQQAIAKIRALQFDQDVASLPQLRIMTELADLCCSIRNCNFVEGDTKRRQVQDLWGEIAESPAWKEKGTLFVPISESSLCDAPIQAGGLVAKREGRYVLPFTWFSNMDAEALCFLLCTVSKAPKNSSDGFKAEQFCREGIQRVRLSDGATSMNRHLLEARFLVELTFLCCMKGNWTQAGAHLSTVLGVVKADQQGHQTFPKSMLAACEYLKGAVYQGTGQLDKAILCWKKPILDPTQYLRQTDASNRNGSLSTIRTQDLETETLHNLSLLALINRLFIIDDPSHQEHSSKDALLTILAAFVKSSPQDRNVTTSCNLAHSLLTNSGIWVSKDRLIKALNEAKAISNQQLTALTLALMQQAFFLGATDPHAQRCVNATSVQVRSWRNPTWMHVVDGILAEALGYQGRLEDAQAKEQQARQSWEQLPEAIKTGVDWQKEPMRKSMAKK